MIRPGRNDAREDTSSIVQDTSYISQFAHDQDTWNKVVECVAAIYAPYDVRVIDEDPGPVRHHEAIVAGESEEIGMEGIWGVAPSQCAPAENVISYTFANEIPNWLNICETVAQESAHSFGLEHSFDCSDPMTYLPRCGRRFFRDKATVCGEYSERPCQCGGTAQNSHRWLLSVLGESNEKQIGPAVSIDLPQEGEQVSTGFELWFQAEHIRGVSRVELHINGRMVQEIPGRENDHTYRARTPTDLADGVLDVEVHAYDDLGTRTVQRVTVQKGAPCENAAACHSGQSCDAGRCLWPAPTAQLGESCGTDFDCVSGLCPTASGESLCSQWCFAASSTPTCPDGFECLGVGGNDGVCWPNQASGDSGCQTGTGRPSGVALLLFAIGIVVVRKQRQR